MSYQGKVLYEFGDDDLSMGLFYDSVRDSYHLVVYDGSVSHRMDFGKEFASKLERLLKSHKSVDWVKNDACNRLKG